MIEELRMAELLCTRLCHDLTGPIGAVNNGAEFLSEEGFSMQNQAVELIESSAFSAVSRLQFYRLAYGRVKDHGEASLSDKKQMALDFFTGSKIEIDWPDAYTDASDVSISMKMLRLMFNVLIVASGVLIRGGRISLEITEQEESKHVRLELSGETLKWENEEERILTEKGIELKVQDMDPKNVQFYFTRRIAEELSAEIRAESSSERLVLYISQPCVNGS